MQNKPAISQPIIFALDTSSKSTGIAVMRGGLLLKINSAIAEKRSETLWDEIESLLAEIELTIHDVDVFSVCVGPGGFTGLRVGMAAVKGFSAARKKPIVGVSSLEAAAFAAKTGLPVCSMVNAYKGEVYSQLFSFDQEGAPVAISAPMVSVVEKVIENAAGIGELIFAGDGTSLIEQSDLERGEGKWTVKPSDNCPAEDIARLALLKYGRGDVETAESLTACYVRRAEAEIKLSQGLLGTKIKRSMKP
jgi:tRNA threonylcarbamoyladenosine biosynthesis protein TsaB